MAELNTDDSSKGGKHQKKRAKKSSTKVDMTPMVDLAFLLLTFFVLTATFGKPKTMQLNMPVKAKNEDQKQKVSDNAITMLLTDNIDSIYYYNGIYDPAKTVIRITNYSKEGVRKLLLESNKDVVTKVHELEEQYKKGAIADSTLKKLKEKVQSDVNTLAVIVKTEDKTKYKNIVDLVDELNICDVAKFSIGDISTQEQNHLTKLKL